MDDPAWSELPADIFCSVIQLLECPDILRSSAVCTGWNKAFSSVRRISACPARQTPCLLYCTNATGQTALGIYSLSERRAYTMPLPADPPVSNWIGSSHGWLVAMDDKSDLMLLNPITHDKVALPPAASMEHVKPILDDHGALHKYEMSYYYGAESKRPKDEPPYAFSLDEYGDVVYLKATLSSDPSTGGCTVMLIHQPYWQLSFAKVGDDHWTWLRADFSYKDCVYHDGLFYAMTGQGAIDSFDLMDHRSSKKGFYQKYWTLIRDATFFRHHGEACSKSTGCCYSMIMHPMVKDIYLKSKYTRSILWSRSESR